jgi:hypothetical protein
MYLYIGVLSPLDSNPMLGNRGGNSLLAYERGIRDGSVLCRIVEWVVPRVRAGSSYRDLGTKGHGHHTGIQYGVMFAYIYMNIHIYIYISCLYM